VFGLVLEEPFRDQIQRRFDVDASEEPVLPDTAGATVPEPEVSEGSLESKATEPTIAVDPGLKSDSAVVVDLAATGAEPKQAIVARGSIPASLKSLVEKYCVATCEIPIERIVQGNNPRLVRQSGVKIIQDAIQNSGWDESSIFIVQLVSDDEKFSNPENVRKDEALLKYCMDEGKHALVNGHHREKAVANLKAIHFSLFPLPNKFLCKICVGITKWDHFLISKKANFVSSAAVEDSMYDKIFALEFAMQQYQSLYPHESQTEKKIKQFYETEVGEKAMSAGSFNLYFNLSKTLTEDAKELLKARTTDANHDFCTTDAMKTVIHVSKNVFKNRGTLVRDYQIYSIDLMYRHYVSSGEKKLSSTTFNSLSSYIVMHVEFRQTTLYKIAEELNINVEQVVLPPPVESWFQEHLINFDTSPAALECCVQFVKDTAGLLSANPSYLPFELRQIVTRAVNTLTSSVKKVQKKSNKRELPPSEEEESGASATTTPVKHIQHKGKRISKKQTVPQLQATNTNESNYDPDATEEEMDVEEKEVNKGDHLAEEHLYDPSTPYRCPSEEVVRRAEEFWIGPHNSLVNTPESDAVAKAKAEWVQVHGTPLNLSETDGLKPGAFVCVDVREFGDYYGTSFESIMKLAPALLLRGGCLVVMGSIQQVRIVLL